VKQLHGGLVFKVHRSLHHSILGLREIKKKKKTPETQNLEADTQKFGGEI
jgi:hypothetical protein